MLTERYSQEKSSYEEQSSAADSKAAELFSLSRYWRCQQLLVKWPPSRKILSEIGKYNRGVYAAYERDLEGSVEVRRLRILSDSLLALLHLRC